MKSNIDQQSCDVVDLQHTEFTHVVHIGEGAPIPAQKNGCHLLLGKVLAALMFSTAIMMLFPIYPVLASLQSSPQQDDSHFAPLSSEAEIISADLSRSRDQVNAPSTLVSERYPQINRSSDGTNKSFQDATSSSSNPVDDQSVHVLSMSSVTSSATSLDQLYKVEHQVVQRLRQILTLADHKLDLIDSYLSAYDARTTFRHTATSNPVRDFVLLQRIEEFWKPELLDMTELIKSLQDVSGLVQTVGQTPGSQEAIEAMSALLMSQEVYRLDIKQMMTGVIEGLPAGEALTSDDVEKMASVAFTSGAYSLGLIWLEALEQYLTEKRLPHQAITDQLEKRKQQHDDLLRTGTPGHQLFDVPIGNNTVSEHEAEMQELSTNNVDEMGSSSAVFSSLCRGESRQNVRKTENLYCTHAVPHSYFHVQSLKLEILSTDPHIVVYRNFLSAKTAKQLTITAKPKMRRSTVGPYGSTVWTRVSSTARLDHQEDLVERVERQIQMATGLETRDRPGYRQERFQVAEYGTAGFFSLHHDYFNMSLYEDTKGSNKSLQREQVIMEAGERTATFMLYLNRVERGGYTVFPQLGIFVPPEEGSAVFWYNILEDGRLDTRTVHAGCPVLYGHKWIANKFIRDTAQTFTRPCKSDK